MGDWDGDGYINGADLALWQANYNPLGLTILAEEPPVELAGGSAAGPDDLTFEPLGDFGTPVASNEPAAATPEETVKILPEVLIGKAVTSILLAEAPAAPAASLSIEEDVPADDLLPAAFMPPNTLADRLLPAAFVPPGALLPAVFGTGVTRVSAAPDAVQTRTAQRAAAVYRRAMRRDVQADDAGAFDLLSAAAPVL
jgi:hypothetical protein